MAISSGFVIKRLVKGQWSYFYGDYHKGGEGKWDTDLYVAFKFKSSELAEQFLMDRIKLEHWGGYFMIEKYFVSK